MTHLIYLYDVVKKLNIFLLGEWDNYDRDSGMLKELDQVCKVIGGGACAEIRLQGEDEIFERLTDILDDSKTSPEERAKMLTEYGETETEKKNKRITENRDCRGGLCFGKKGYGIIDRGGGYAV